MKLSNLFWNLLGIMVLSACSNSDMTENDLSLKLMLTLVLCLSILRILLALGRERQVISPEIFMKKGKVLKMM